MMGPEVRRYGSFFVTDDGHIGQRYSVRADMEDNTTMFIAGGASLGSASIVAESLSACHAGNPKYCTLNECQGSRFQA